MRPQLASSALRASLHPLLATNSLAIAQRECDSPGLAFEIVGEELLAHARAIGGGNVGTQAWLSKWWLIGLTQFDLVLSIDLDVDLLEVAYGRLYVLRGGVETYVRDTAHTWARELPIFMRSRYELLGAPDHMSPVNGGVLWFKPSREAFAAGLALIATRSFNEATGWNASGSLRAQMPAEYAAMSSINNSQAMRVDRWDFVAANGDQGLLTQVYILGRRSYRPLVGSRWSVRHHWGSGKPWQRGSCYMYYAQLGLVKVDDAANAMVAAPANASTAARLTLSKQPLRLVTPPPAGPPGSRCWPLLKSTAAILAQYDPTAPREMQRRQQGRRSERLPYHLGGSGLCVDGIQQPALRRG
jgi:hypothetical protein